MSPPFELSTNAPFTPATAEALPAVFAVPMTLEVTSAGGATACRGARWSNVETPMPSSAVLETERPT